MTKQEFEKRIGLVITSEEYEEIEKTYMGLPESVDKDRFVKIWLTEGGIQDLFDKRAIVIQSLKDNIARLEEDVESERRYSGEMARNSNANYSKAKSLEEKLSAISAMAVA